MSLCFDVCCGSGEEDFKASGFSSMDDSEFWPVDDSVRLSATKTREKAALALELKRRNGRSSIFASPLDVTGEWNPPMYDKTNDDAGFLRSVMKDHILFDELSSKELDALIGATERVELQQGDRAVRQHAKGEYLFIVQEGQLDMYCEVDQNYHGIVKEGQVFGELALLWGKEFAVSIIAKVPATVVWRLEQSIFRHVVARHAREQDANIVNNLRKVAIFQQLQDSILQKVAGNLTRVHFREGETIYTKGEIGETFYIIESGSARVHDIGIGDSRSSEYTLHDGDAFGELSLLTGEPRAASITAITNVSTLAMDRWTFQENVGDLQELIHTQARKQCLKGLPIFANARLTEIEFDRLAESMQQLSYKKGTKLAQIGQVYAKKVWFVLKGQIIVFGNKSGQIYNLMAGDYFGEKSILSARDHVSSHEAICEENLDAWVLSSDDIESIVVKMDRLGHVGDYVKSKQQKSDVSGLADLTKRRVLGQGGFGKVWLVESKASGKPFALKEISKRKLLELKQERSVLREKELLGLLHHPFIIDLVSSFQDASNLYLVLPLVQGGELFSLVASKSRNGHGIPNNDAAFYAAGIVAALGHFHHRLIAYRDMKLENVMIDSQGYPKIVDLGFARIIVEKSYTFCGTPEYLAPEIIMSKGHNHAVDYWSFGVLVFEMLVGRSPFNKADQSQMDMFKRIVMVQYDCPPLVSRLGQDLLNQLLVRPISKRIGAQSRGHLDIVDHGWFNESGVNFKSMLKGDMTAPWVPQVRDPFDASNFEDFRGTENEQHNLGHTLAAAQQAIFKDF